MKQKFHMFLRSFPGYLKKMARFCHKHWFVFFAIAFYLFFTASSMGPSFVHCRDRIYGLGDSTAGPVWKNSLKPEQPIFGAYENSTNYPKGESLYSPVNYSSAVQSVGMSIGTKIVGPVCAYNMSNIIGYLSTSLIMFAFIRYLTRSRWIALLAGYAAAFTPYIQSKIGGHPSYAYASLLIALIWLILHIIKTRKKRFAALLAVVLTICSYFDPYFILLAVTITGPMLVVWLAYALLRLRKGRENKKNVIATIKVFLIGFGLFLVLMSPLLIVIAKESKTIQSSVSAVRGNVTAAAMQCSNKPLDYILPDPRNDHLVSLLGDKYITKNISLRNWCGFGESRVAISLTMLTVIFLGVLVLFWERLNGRRTKLGQLLSYNPHLLIWSIAGVGLAALLIGLPPYWHGHIMPSGVILKVTETWRIFAREYMVLNVAVVVLFAVIVKYFSSVPVALRHKRTLAVLFVCLFFGINVEYQINPPFHPPNFSYSEDVPKVYQQVRDNKDIQVIAEYPLDRSGIEHDSIVYYLTMQTYHGKKIFNAAAIKDSNENIHIALKDLTDPQTLPALRTLGIKYVVIHSLSPEQIRRASNQLQILGDSVVPVYALTMITSGGTNDTVLTKIADGPKVDSILTFEKGFTVNFDVMKNSMDQQYEVAQDTTLKVTPLSNKPQKTEQNFCFDAKMSASTDIADLTVSVNGVPRQTLPIDGDYQTIVIRAKDGDTIALHNSKGYNMRLNNLGCVQ